MTAAAFALRLVDHALAELSERAETLPLDQLRRQLDDIEATGRSATCDLVAAILAREIERRDREARA